MDKPTRNRFVTAAVFIVLGLTLFGLQYLENVGKSVVMLVLGGTFTGLYLYTRSYFAMLVGGILLGLGVGSFGEQYFYVWGEFSHVGLGGGFILIYLVPLLYERCSHWWPLIPGTILILIGFGKWHQVWTFLFDKGWPLLLVLIGVLILLGAVGKKKKKEDEPKPAE